MTTQEIIKTLNWRYATKVFDPNKKLSSEQLDTLIDSMVLTPSSFGLQPWKFVIVENQEKRESLVEHSWNQKQVADASHLIVLCRVNNIDENFVNNFITQLANSKKIEANNLDSYKQMILGSLSTKNENELKNWAKNQIYIALGNLMYTSALLGIDACPMEGFNSQKYDEILGLDELGISSVLVCPVGFRSTDDKYSTVKKFRFDKKDIVIKLD